MLEGNNLKVLIILVLLIVFIITWLILTLRSISFQKRISNYVVSKNKNEDISILGKLEKFYLKVRRKMVKSLKRYVKRKNKTKKEIEEELIFTCDKILSSLIFLGLYLIISLVTFKVPNMLLIITFLLLGYLFPVFKKSIIQSINRKKIEKDLLKAISLINSSLQSGKSIMQAIRTVATELDGPMALEFEKVGKDLEGGLSLTVAFKRFEKRVDLEEVRYITVSLLILNQTGGNIISIFKSLEDRFYMRRKLDSELKAVIASSKLIFQVLIVLPFLIYLLIGLWNPSYFTIFFKSSLGMMLFGIIALIYLLYVVVIRSIMKVEKY